MTIPRQAAHQLFGFPEYQRRQPMTDPTRHLCTAAYLDDGFADAVIKEVVEDEHRAVAPSWDIDLDPVVRHCLRAQRQLLARDLLLAAAVALGLYLSPLITIGWLLLGALALNWRPEWIRQAPARVRAGRTAATVTVVTVLLFCGLVGTALGALELFGDPGATDPVGPPEPSWFERAFGGAGLVAPLVLAVVSFGVAFGFRLAGYQVITRDLAGERAGPLPELGSGRVAQRLATVAAAQYGNVVYQTRDPFLGAGELTRAWSFALSPRRREPADPLGMTPPPLPLDELGAALNRAIQRAVERMRGEGLPGGVGIPNLYLVPYLVADGVRAHDDPLLDPERPVPYPLAHPDAVAAIIRRPQAGLRQYQRIVVGGPGEPVYSADGRLVLPPQDLGITVSAFVHVAVEGGRLYIEFIATVMPPVKEQYTLADRMRPERVVPWALRDSALSLPGASTASAWRAARTLWRMASRWWRMDRALLAAQDLRVYDYGARLSVRERAAEPALDSFLQRLDDLKYGKLIERAVTEAIVECLEQNGYDTTEFTERVSNVQNVNIYGGQQAFDSSNPTFQQHNQAGSPSR